MEQLRQVLGYSTRLQVDAFLQQHQINDYTVADLEKDMETLQRAYLPVTTCGCPMSRF